MLINGWVTANYSVSRRPQTRYTHKHTHNDSIRWIATHCISPKIKANYDDLAINGFERGFKEGTRFILYTYIYFRYPCIKITQTNIYSQLARVSFLCTLFLVFYLLDNRFAWYQDSSACLAINGGHVRSVSWAPDGCYYCCSCMNMDRVPGLPGSAAAVWIWIEPGLPGSAAVVAAAATDLD